MKNTTPIIPAICLIVLFAILVAVIIGTFVLCAKIHEIPELPEEYYPMTGKVVRTSSANDTVTIRDFNGNYWQFKEVEDWRIGDIASCIMYNNGTPYIKDDVIVKVQYDGWLNGWAD